MSRAAPVRRDISWVLPACAVLLALVLIAQSLWGIWRFWDVFPVSDMMTVLWRYMVGPAREFWIFHDNEHLPLAVMPLYWLDMRAFGAQGWSLIVCIVVLAAAIALAPLPAVRRAMPGRLWLVAAFACASVAMQLWLGGWVNLLWTKQVHMYLSLFGVVMAIGVVARGGPARWPAAVAACAWAALAMFSFGYGIVAFPVVLVLGLWRRWSWVWLGGVAGTAMLCLVAYLALAAPLLGPHSHLLWAEGNLSLVTMYALTFVASPAYNALQPFSSGPAAFGVSYALVAAGAAWYGLRLWQRRHAPPSELLAWAVGLALFTIIVGCQTAWARFFFGFEQAADRRYIVGQLPFWLGLLLLAADTPSLWRGRGQAAIGAVLALTMATLLLSQQTVFAAMRGHAFERYNSAMAALDGVTDPAINAKDEWSHPNRPPIVVAGLRARGWSVFAWPQAKWIGRDIASFGINGTGCMGAFDTLTPVGAGAGFRADGWAADTASSARSVWVLLADDRGIVRGVAHGGAQRADVASFLHAPGLLYAGWRGYLPASVQRAGLSAWLLMKGKHPCRLGPLPAIPAMPR